MVAVCILIHGNNNYLRAGKEAVFSVLDHSDFHVYAVLAPGQRIRVPANRRLHIVHLEHLQPIGHRSERFLLKFSALKKCLANNRHDLIVMLDADAVFVENIHVDHLWEALDGHPLGMVEQTTVIGSDMSRRDFLKHYTEYSLACIAPDAVPPDLKDFRFFNSGFVLGEKTEIGSITSWALDNMNQPGKEHQVGHHMIADQDYFQYWINNMHPGSCVSLPWYWNHCKYWDEGFPRKGEKVLHFSNFCNGPDKHTLKQMRMCRNKEKSECSVAASLRSRLKRFFLPVR